MRQRYEIVDFGPQMPVRCTMQRIGSIGAHLHDFFEIIFVLSGTCQIRVDGRLSTLNAEDVIAVNPHTPHELQGVECVLISVQFQQSIFEQTLPNPQHPDFFCDSSQQGDSAAFMEIRRLIARLVKNNADRQLGFELRNWSLIYELMDVMFNNFRVDGELRSYRYAARVERITAIMNERFTEKYGLAELADELHLSAPYLSKFFDAHFGMSFLAYRTELRLGRAVSLLEKTEDNIETVSAESGFPNSYAFVQAFKKEYGVLPSIYRRQYRAERSGKPDSPVPVVEQHDYMAGLKKYLDAPTQAARPEQVITCPVRLSRNAAARPLCHTWRKLTGISHARGLLFADGQEMVRRAAREISFETIKFGGVFSDDLHVYSEDAKGQPVYDFTYLDRVFDFLKNVSMRPMVELGYMPRLLARDPNRFLFNELVSEPSSLAKWSSLVSAFFSHLLSRYGEDEVSKWLFTLWHQPDTPETMYGFSTDQAFYSFWSATYRAVKEVCPTIALGAPPTFYIARPGYENWYLPFLRWCRENGCVPDFLNFNFYDTSLSDKSGTQEAFGFVMSMTLGEDPNGLSNFVDRVTDEAKSAAPGLPIFLSEWNTSPSQQDLLNDTCFKSCYIVKSVLENYDRLDAFGYWSLTDWMGEAPLPRELFFGGLGLFTANGIPKASYYAFTLLSRLGDTLMGRGDGWFAVRRGDKYQFLLYNYRHFSRLYAQGERFDMTFTDRYTPFSPEQSLDVHISLTDMEDGQYTVRETVINRRSGSAFDRWIDLGALEPDTDEELAALKALSTPAVSKYRVTCRRHTLELDAMLDMLEVRLLEITKN